MFLVFQGQQKTFRIGFDIFSGNILSAEFKRTIFFPIIDEHLITFFMSHSNIFPWSYLLGLVLKNGERMFLFSLFLHKWSWFSAFFFPVLHNLFVFFLQDQQLFKSPQLPLCDLNLFILGFVAEFPELCFLFFMFLTVFFLFLFLFVLAKGGF